MIDTTHNVLEIIFYQSPITITCINISIYWFYNLTGFVTLEIESITPLTQCKCIETCSSVYNIKIVNTYSAMVGLNNKLYKLHSA